MLSLPASGSPAAAWDSSWEQRGEESGPCARHDLPVPRSLHTQLATEARQLVLSEQTLPALGVRQARLLPYYF